jgi:hypothetical protein
MPPVSFCPPHATDAEGLIFPLTLAHGGDDWRCDVYQCRWLKRAAIWYAQGDLVLGLEAVLADGRSDLMIPAQRQFRPEPAPIVDRLRRHAGIITKAVLELAPKPITCHRDGSRAAAGRCSDAAELRARRDRRRGGRSNICRATTSTSTWPASTAHANHLMRPMMSTS